MKLPEKCRLCINPEINLKSGKCKLNACKKKENQHTVERPKWMKNEQA